MEYILNGPKRKKFGVLKEEKDKSAYLSLYDNWNGETYALDASTYYLSTPKIAERIYEANPEARIIAILREPVERAFSHYLMELRDGWINESFEQALIHEIKEMHSPKTPWGGHYCMIRNSLYLNGLESYYRLFGKDKMRVYLFEDVDRNAQALLADISQYLGIELLSPGKTDEPRNSYAHNRFPIISKMVNAYRCSHARDVINVITPREARIIIGNWLNQIRFKEKMKPTITHQERKILHEQLGDDYEKSLTFIHEKGLLFENS